MKKLINLLLKTPIIKDIIPTIKEGPEYVVNLIISKIFNNIYGEGLPCKILFDNDLILYLIKEKKSLIRFGDGDIRFLLGGSVYYQKSIKAIKSILNNILKNYNTTSPYVLAVPGGIIKSKSQLIAERKLWVWGTSKYYLRNKIKKTIFYGDSTIFYSKNITYTNVEKLWAGGGIDAIIIIHFNPAVYQKIKAENPNKTVYFIEAPDREAFERRKEILVKIEDIIYKNKIPTSRLRILITCGVTSRYLVYEVSKLGYIAYDMGVYFGLSKMEDNSVKY